MCYGNQFIGGTYHILEEEMMLSLTSLEAPLNERGYKRMKELFALWYGKKDRGSRKGHTEQFEKRNRI